MSSTLRSPEGMLATSLVEYTGAATGAKPLAAGSTLGMKTPPSSKLLLTTDV